MLTKTIIATMLFSTVILLAANEATWALIINGILALLLAVMDHRSKARSELLKLEILNATISLSKLQEKVQVVDEKVEIVHKATNSLVAQAVEGGRKEGELAGAASERDRAERVAATAAGAKAELVKAVDDAIEKKIG